MKGFVLVWSAYYYNLRVSIGNPEGADERIEAQQSRDLSKGI